MTSPEKIKFHFDPRCPWCYQTSRWARRVEELGLVEIEWAIFCLEIANAPEGTDVRTIDARSGPALRTVVAIRNEGRTDLVGPFYSALGKQIWEQSPPEKDMATAVRRALEVVGLDPTLCDKALGDSSTWDAVVDEHQSLVERTQSFGVPTIVLDGGDGPAIFGPVISELPNDEDATELWKHASWLVRYENFAELKRGRVKLPDLPAIG